MQLRISIDEQDSGESAYVAIASNMVTGNGGESYMYTFSISPILINLTTANNLSLQIYTGQDCNYRVKNNRTFLTVEAIN